MSKIHTKQKRVKGLKGTSKKHRFCFTRVVAKKGPKSFKTKEAAEAYGNEHKMDEKTHVLHALKAKFQWREKPRV